jgi:predicted ATPase
MADELTSENCRIVLDMVRNRRWGDLAGHPASAKLAPIASDCLSPGEQWETASAEAKGIAIRELCEKTINELEPPPAIRELAEEILKELETRPDQGLRPFLTKLPLPWLVHWFLKGYYLEQKTRPQVMHFLGLYTSDWTLDKRIRPRAFDDVCSAWRKKLRGRLLAAPAPGRLESAEQPEAETKRPVEGVTGTSGRPVPETPARPEVVVTRTASAYVTRTKEELTITYHLENRGGIPAKDVRLAVAIPKELSLVEGDQEFRTDLEPGARISKEHIFRALEEGQAEFARQSATYRDPERRTYQCDVEPLVIEVQFAVASDLVGREHELRQLRGISRGALAGRGQVILVSGPAGVGKSRLIEEFAKEARVHGFRVIYGRCSRLHEEIPFLPFREVVRELCGLATEAGAGVNESGMGGSALTLDPLLQHLVSTLTAFLYGGIAGEGGETHASAERLQPTIAREQFFFATLRLLEVCCDRQRQQGLIICLEDLQWADSGTVDLIEFLARRLLEVPVIIVGTYREEEDRPFGAEQACALWETLRSVLRADLLHEIRLRPLNEAESYSVLDSVFLDHDFPDEFKRRVFEETEGNALFLMCVLRSLWESGVVTKAAGKWTIQGDASRLRVPDTVGKLIRIRLDGLPMSQRDELEKASVIGREFPFSALRGLSEKGEDELIDCIENLVRRDLIKELDPSEERFAFSHGKIQEILYDGIPGLRRRRLHRSVATIVEELYSGQPYVLMPLLAYHYYQAGDRDTATKYLLASAELSARRYNHEEALQSLARAQDTAGQPGESDPSLHIRVCTVMGHIHKNKGEYGEARQHYERCLEWARIGGNRSQEVWTLDNLADLSYLQGDYQEAERLYLECLSHAEAEQDTQLQVEVLADLGELCFRMSEQEAAFGHFEAWEQRRQTGKEYLRKVLDLAPKVSDFESLRRAYNFWGIIWLCGKEYAKAIEAVQAAMALATKHGLSLYALNNLGNVYRLMGDHVRALECYERFLDYAVGVGAMREQAIAYNNIGLLHSDKEEYDQALGYLERSLALKETLGLMSRAAETLILKGEVFERRGDAETASDMYRQALRLQGTLSDSDRPPDIVRKVGFALFGSALFDRAARYLRAYLYMKPDARDAAVVKKVLEFASA